jgi:hypothetical protein
MSANTLMQDFGAVSESLAATDELLAELSDQVKSFNCIGQDFADGYVPQILPDDFSIETVTAEISRLRQKRHSDSVKLRDLKTSWEQQRAIEQKRKMDALAREYRKKVAAMLEQAVSFALSVEACANLREQAIELTGTSANLRHIGPQTGGWNQWNIRDPQGQTPVLFWLAEAKVYDLIKGDEPWLTAAGIQL